MESPSASGTEEKDTMNKDSISNGKDSITVQASIQIGKRDIVFGTDIPMEMFYSMFADLCEAVIESMLDDGLREDAEKVAEIIDRIREARE